jgi:hypothetical protein
MISLISGLLRFFAEARFLRMDRYRDYARESRSYDGYSNQELLEGLDATCFVKLADVRKIYKSVSGREGYRLSSCDYDEFVMPFFDEVMRRVRRGEMECRMLPDEELSCDARVKVGDLSAMLSDSAFPDGKSDGLRATTLVAVPVDPDFGATLVDEIRRKIYEVAPLRTPSIDVTYEKVAADHALDIFRPLILSIGMASVWKAQNLIIESAAIPTYQETAIQRTVLERRRRENRSPRVYRGIRMK